MDVLLQQHSSPASTKGGATGKAVVIINSPGYRFRRGTGSPFDVVNNPDVDLGTDGTFGIPCQWCNHCQMSVETRSESHNQNQVFVEKHWCKRCGNVTASAVYYHVQSFDEPETPLLRKAVAWMNEMEEKG